MVLKLLLVACKISNPFFEPLNGFFELLSMDQNEWKKSFHDEIDVGSERSDTGLITESPTRRWSEKRVLQFSVRLIIESVLVVLVVGLSAVLITQSIHGHRSLSRYGPSCESSLENDNVGASYLTTKVPSKKVIFGNAADIGPDLVYADNEMLRNATRLREVHENWQALFPSEHFTISFQRNLEDSFSPRAQILKIICRVWLTFPTGGRGYVIVDESKVDFTVHNPPFNIDREGKIGTTDGQGKGWILSVYHQLHCLVSTVGGHLPSISIRLHTHCKLASRLLSQLAWVSLMKNLPSGMIIT